MIDHENKCIFVHIPRTSGTSIESAFGFNMDQVKKQKHWTADDIYREVGDATWNSYFRFSFVRNPWDRVVSLYHQPSFRHINSLSEKPLRFFLDHYVPQPHEGGKTCSDYLNHGSLDFVGRFEDRDRDLCEVLKQFGIAPDTQRHERKTSHAHYTTYYDDVTRELVRKHYAEDIERFGYQFGD